MTESDLMRSLQIEASAAGARLFRQNVGLAWVGTKIERGSGRAVWLGPDDIVIRQARPFRAGVPGMSDLGGWVPVTITPHMVGGWLAVYTQVEIKKHSRVSDEQRQWIEVVNAAGGRAGVARSSADLRQILQIP